MQYPSAFDPQTLRQNLARLEALGPSTPARWGKMNAAQMLAHLNVAYDMETGRLPVRLSAVTRWLLKVFAKQRVVGPKPYSRNSRTAPWFRITDERDFAAEKLHLTNHLRRVMENGAAYYEGRENVSFGKLTAGEWSRLYQKHLEHHFGQFGL